MKRLKLVFTRSTDRQTHATKAVPSGNEDTGVEPAASVEEPEGVTARSKHLQSLVCFLIPC